MAPITTLSEFLLQAGTEYRIYDLGRGIRRIPEQTFLDIEHSQQPYPYPRQTHAWLGIIFWNKNVSNEHYIWFLKLPVDEASLLMSGPRDHFLSIVVEALEKETSNTSDSLSKVENPYSFTPNQQTVADFNAMTKKALRLPPSRYYQETRQFLSAPSVMKWQLLAAQGIADFCSLISESNNTDLLIKAFPTLTAPVKSIVMSSLENHQLEAQLVSVLITQAKSAPNDVNIIAQTLRALAQSQHHQFVQDYVIEVIRSKKVRDINILSVIVGRHWQLLANESILISLLEHATAVSFDVCNGLYRDLVMLPTMRQLMLALLRKELKNKQLNECLTQIKLEFKR